MPPILLMEKYLTFFWRILQNWFKLTVRKNGYKPTVVQRMISLQEISLGYIGKRDAFSRNLECFFCSNQMPGWKKRAIICLKRFSCNYTEEQSTNCWIDMIPWKTGFWSTVITFKMWCVSLKIIRTSWAFRWKWTRNWSCLDGFAFIKRK